MTGPKARMVPEDAQPSVKTQLAVFGAGLFANSSQTMISVILPLWLVALGHSPFLMGIVLGARSILPLIFSIHGGALMDRFGTRRIMLGCAVVSAVIPLLYPMSIWTWALFLLQMVVGLTATLNWMGAQTLIGQLMKGSPVYAGRLTFSSRIGQLAGPPIVGLFWDLTGAWGAFLFLAFWGACGVAACLLLPDIGKADRGPPRRVVITELLPRIADYRETFLLLRNPAILVIVASSMLSVAGNGIQSSFYVVYLEGIGFSGTLIGLLLSAMSTFGLAGALMVGIVTRIGNPMTLLVLIVIAEVVAIAVTPLFHLLTPLFILIAFRGFFAGVAHPLTVANLGHGAEANAQGKAVGLRTTANRLTGLVTPILMGSIVEVVGLDLSFYVTGGIIILMLACFLPMASRTGR